MNHIILKYKVLWKFQQEEKRLPTTNEVDMKKLKSLRDSLMTPNDINVLTATDNFLW
jgi:hypothetical protein